MSRTQIIGKQIRNYFRPSFPAAFIYACSIILMIIHLTAGAQDRKNPVKNSDNEVIKLHSDLVVLNMTVTDAGGKFAHGLTSRDFSVKEDNVSQTCDALFTEEAPFAAAILIDMSGSMEYKYGLARSAAASFLEHIRPDDQVAVFGFNIKVYMIQDFSDSRDISDNIWDTKAEDYTKLYDCADTALSALEKRSEKRRAIVLISDGCDNLSQKATFDSVLKRAFKMGVTIYTVDIIDDELLQRTGSLAAELRRGKNELIEFARKTGGINVRSPKGDKLEEAFINIVEELRNQYTLTYYPTNTIRDGKWRTISVGSMRPGLSVRTRPGYYAPR